MPIYHSILDESTQFSGIAIHFVEHSLTSFLQDFFTQFFCLMYHIELGNRLLFARTMHITEKPRSIALPNSCTILSEGPSSSKEITGHTCSTQIFPEFLESSHKSKFHTSQFFVRCIIIHGRNECYLV